MAHGSFNKNKYVVKKIIHKYNPLCETSVPRVLFSKASCMIYTAIHIYGYAFYWKILTDILHVSMHDFAFKIFIVNMIMFEYL